MAVIRLGANSLILGRSLQTLADFYFSGSNHHPKCGLETFRRRLQYYQRLFCCLIASGQQRNCIFNIYDYLGAPCRFWVRNHENNRYRNQCKIEPALGGDRRTDIFDLGAPLGWFWVPFWRPLHFEGVPKSIIFNKSNIKPERRCAGKCLDKTGFLKIFDVKMGGLDEPKQAFRIIPVAKYEFSGSCEV